MAQTWCMQLLFSQKQNDIITGTTSACLLQVIAFLDTGSGKTLVAALLLEHRIELARASGQPSWRAAFLAPKVALVQQQAGVMKDRLGKLPGVRVSVYIGAHTEAWEADT
jgi:replicative superfamily II helicase